MPGFFQKARELGKKASNKLEKFEENRIKMERVASAEARIAKSKKKISKSKGKSDSMSLFGDGYLGQQMKR